MPSVCTGKHPSFSPFDYSLLGLSDFSIGALKNYPKYGPTCLIYAYIHILCTHVHICMCIYICK